MEKPSSSRGVRPAFTLQEWLIIYLIRNRQGLNLYSLCGWTEHSLVIVGENLTRAESYLNLDPNKSASLPLLSGDSRVVQPSRMLTPIRCGSSFTAHTYQSSSQRCSEVQKECWNGEHKMHALVFTILVTANDKIVWVSRCDPANKHDTTAWTESGGPELLHEKYGEVVNSGPIAPKLAICGDEAYCRASIPTGWEVHVTMSGVNANDLEGKAGKLESEPISLNIVPTSASTSTSVPQQTTTNNTTTDTINPTKKKGKRFSKNGATSSGNARTKSSKQQRQEFHTQQNVHKALPKEVVLDSLCAKFRAVVERTFARIKPFSPFITS